MWISRAFLFFLPEWTGNITLKSNLSAPLCIDHCWIAFSLLCVMTIQLSASFTADPPPTQKKKKLSTLSGQTVACHRSQLKETKDQKAHINSHINSSPSQTGFKSCASLTIAWPECIWGKVVFLYLEGSCTQVTFVWQSESSQNFHRSAAIQKKIK